MARTPTAMLSQVTRDFVYLIAVLSGWLAVGIATLLPSLIEPVFGQDFRPVLDLLPWFAVFALTKGGEVALYRLLFCFRRQSWYAGSLAVGTVVIVALNLALIPRFALRGAIAAAIASTLVVNVACLYGLRRLVSLSSFASAAARVALALAVTAAIYLAAGGLHLNPLTRGLACCALYPIAALLAGLVPDWRNGLLFSRGAPESDSSDPPEARSPTGEIPNGAPPPIPLALAEQRSERTQTWWTPELLEFTNDAIIIWEMDGRGILYWNRAAEQLYGYSRDEAAGRVTHTLLHTRLAGVVAANQLEVALARYGIWVGELSHRTRAGDEITVEARLAVMAQENGRWLVLEVNRDISDGGRAEATRVSAEIQLGRVRSQSGPTGDSPLPSDRGE
ncbi:MAG: PAS domain S-box protein [Sinobacteraceae bacterium]|nr:PAS domain S-box protein [Nevskiaceae bacterium]